MPANFARFLPQTCAALIGAAAALWCAGSAPAGAQAASESAMRETLAIGEEPGRVSTEEVVITDGPYRRQLVFFRTNEAPGTFVIQTAEHFLYAS